MESTLPRLFDQDRYQRLFEKGLAHWRNNAIAEAKASFRAILRDKPTHAETLRFLALTIRKEGQLPVAREIFERAVRANPQHAGILCDFANLLIESNELDAAAAIISKAETLAPGLSDLHANLGLLKMRQGDDAAAIAHFEHALALSPSCMISKANLATCRNRAAPPGTAPSEIETLTETVEREPDNAKAHLMLALKLDEAGMLSRALIHAYRSCQIEATASNLSQLASFMCTLGDFSEAMPLFEMGVERAPYSVNIGSAYLFAMNYNPATSAEELFETYKVFAEKFLKPKKKFRQTARNTAGRKLKIGYSSPDFREHSMFYFITPILAAHDKSRFELVAYSNSDITDDRTETLRGHFDHWVDVTRLSDEAMAQKIMDDGIDILVDLAGHSRGNRLGVFAMRAAPVQISYLGYGYTTGISEMDYFIGDENLTPPEANRYFTEKVWRVPAPAYVYSPPPAAEVAVGSLPALRKGYVTFGSMSRLIRMNDEVLRSWAEIVNRVPGSKLRLDCVPIADPETRDLMVTRLIKLGFAPGQLEVGCSRPHWQGYAEFDIALDCWPHNTGTTTLDALYMGVPVLTKLDRPSVGRFGATFLRPMGLEDWIATDVPEYIEKAVAFASDLAHLTTLRAELRDRMRQSGLLDPALMTGKLEAMYLEAMRRFEQKKAA